MLLNAVAATVPPAHTTTFDGTVTVDGVHVVAIQLPVPGIKHPVPVGVTVIYTVSPGEREFTVNDVAAPDAVVAPPLFIL